MCLCSVLGISFSSQSTVPDFWPQSRYNTSKDRVLKSKMSDLLIANSVQSRAFSASLEYMALAVLTDGTATRDCQGSSALSSEEMCYRNTL